MILAARELWKALQCGTTATIALSLMAGRPGVTLLHRSGRTSKGVHA